MIKTKEDLKQFISIGSTFTFDVFEPYIKKANRTYIQQYVGKLYFELETIKTDDTFKEEKEEAQYLINTAIANFGYFLFTPFNSVSMDASGMYNAESANRKPINVGQLNDIRRELLRSGHEAMDELLELLEKNPDAFAEWHSNYSTLYKESMVHSTAVFQNHYNIFNSRQTFLALKPSIQQIEDRLLSTTFCSELLHSLKGEVTGVKKELKTLFEKAVVLGTISKVYSEGIFEITPSGIKLKFDLLAYETIKMIELSEQMKNSIQNLSFNADQYLKQAVDLIKKKPTEFTECKGNPLITKEGSGYKIIKTKAVLGL